MNPDCYNILIFLLYNPYDLVSKGSGAHLLKIGSKRRRTKMEIQGAREEERLREEGQDRHQQRLQKLEAQLLVARRQSEEAQGARDCVNFMLQKGLVELDEDGNVQPVE